MGIPRATVRKSRTTFASSGTRASPSRFVVMTWSSAIKNFVKRKKITKKTKGDEEEIEEGRCEIGCQLVRSGEEEEEEDEEDEEEIRKKRKGERRKKKEERRKKKEEERRK